jgi:hypothetical protein
VNRRLALALGVAAAALLVVGAALALALRGEDRRPPAPELRALDVEHCRAFSDDDARSCYSREFLAMVDGVRDPRPAVERITAAARSEGGFLLENCHVVMHTVGRTYARDADVTLGSLMDYLPADNDPGCPAGFAHGLVTGVAPDIDPSDPREAASACDGAGTRFQRYSCIHGFGHAFMRLYQDQLEPALKLCTALGAGAAPDCAQGAYHDYWFAVVGADDATLASGEEATDPYQLCGAQPAEYVRPCWYRAFLENRPAGFRVETPADIRDLCEGLASLQRAGCVTAASVIGPPDPAEQLRICARLRAGSDAANCVRGTKVQNLQDAPTEDYVRLIGGCERFAAAARDACYEWLGKTLAVLTDGEFGKTGCPELRGDAARRACEAGASRIDEPLVTFS